MTSRREAVISAWCEAVDSDARLTSGQTLPHAQRRDHIPALLEDFEQQLQSTETDDRRFVEEEPRDNGAAHGLHRWQQGFDLTEVTRELGWLNEIVVTELDEYARQSAPLEWSAMSEARRIWAIVYGVALSASTARYFRLQQLESASHAEELQAALSTLRELEGRRAELWQQAAHDLRGNLGVVANATAGLSSAQATADKRDELMRLLQRNVMELHRLLEDVTNLARLQGGQEIRMAAPLEAASLLREVCESMHPLAEERQLYLRFSGPPRLTVEGDGIKIRRVVQNLVLNAIKYTQTGGVTLRWSAGEGDDALRWYIEISDTGPGFREGPCSAVAAALEGATRLDATPGADPAAISDAGWIDRAAAPATGDPAVDPVTGDETMTLVQQAPTPSSGWSTARAAESRDLTTVGLPPSEGIGLSIVKRLCELLDATLELKSTLGQGSTFRVILPARYTLS